MCLSSAQLCFKRLGLVSTDLVGGLELAKVFGANITRFYFIFLAGLFCKKMIECLQQRATCVFHWNSVSGLKVAFAGSHCLSALSQREKSPFYGLRRLKLARNGFI